MSLYPIERVSVGVDIGGTFVKVALLPPSGAPVPCGRFARFPVDGDAAAGCFAAEVQRIAGMQERPVSREEEARMQGPFAAQAGARSACCVSALGVAVPGVVDPLSSSMTLSPNADFDLRALLSALRRAFPDADPVVLNDANAAACGEAAFGSGCGERNVLVVTLGTGVGAGFVSEGRILVGAHGAVGEVGHICVDPGGLPCGCGGRGCLEQYASAPGLIASYLRHRGGDSDSALEAGDVFGRAADGDGAACAAVREFSDKLGFGLAQASCVIDPSAIVIGGGLSYFADRFIDDLRASYARYALPVCGDVRIEAASLRNDAGCFGAAAAAAASFDAAHGTRAWELKGADLGY